MNRERNFRLSGLIACVGLGLSAWTLRAEEGTDSAATTPPSAETSKATEFRFKGALSSLKESPEFLGAGWTGPFGRVVDNVKDTDVPETDKDKAKQIKKEASKVKVTATGEFTYISPDQANKITLKAFMFKSESDAHEYWKSTLETGVADKFFVRVPNYGERAVDSKSRSRRIVQVGNAYLICEQVFRNDDHLKLLTHFIEKMTGQSLNGSVASVQVATTLNNKAPETAVAQNTKPEETKAEAVAITPETKAPEATKPVEIAQAPKVSPPAHVETPRIPEPVPPAEVVKIAETPKVEVKAPEIPVVSEPKAVVAEVKPVEVPKVEVKVEAPPAPETKVAVAEVKPAEVPKTEVKVEAPPAPVAEVKPVEPVKAGPIIPPDVKVVEVKPETKAPEVIPPAEVKPVEVAKVETPPVPAQPIEVIKVPPPSDPVPKEDILPNPAPNTLNADERKRIEEARVAEALKAKDNVATIAETKPVPELPAAPSPDAVKSEAEKIAAAEEAERTKAREELLAEAKRNQSDREVLEARIKARLEKDKETQAVQAEEQKSIAEQKLQEKKVQLSDEQRLAIIEADRVYAEERTGDPTAAAAKRRKRVTEILAQASMKVEAPAIDPEAEKKAEEAMLSRLAEEKKAEAQRKADEDLLAKLNAEKKAVEVKLAAEAARPVKHTPEVAKIEAPPVVVKTSEPPVVAEVKAPEVIPVKTPETPVVVAETKTPKAAVVQLEEEPKKEPAKVIAAVEPIKANEISPPLPPTPGEAENPAKLAVGAAGINVPLPTPDTLDKERREEEELLKKTKIASSTPAPKAEIKPVHTGIEEAPAVVKEDPKPVLTPLIPDEAPKLADNNKPVPAPAPEEAPTKKQPEVTIKNKKSDNAGEAVKVEDDKKLPLANHANADGNGYFFNGKLSGLRERQAFLGKNWTVSSGLIINDLSHHLDVANRDKRQADRLHQKLFPIGGTGYGEYIFSDKDTGNEVWTVVYVFTSMDTARIYWRNTFDKRVVIPGKPVPVPAATTMAEQQVLDDPRNFKRVIRCGNIIMVCHQLIRGTDYQKVQQRFCELMEMPTIQIPVDNAPTTTATTAATPAPAAGNVKSE